MNMSKSSGEISDYSVRLNIWNIIVTTYFVTIHFYIFTMDTPKYKQHFIFEIDNEGMKWIDIGMSANLVQHHCFIYQIVMVIWTCSFDSDILPKDCSKF